MAKTTFLLQSDKNPAQIYVRFRDGRTIDCKVRTGQLINPKDWDAVKGWPIDRRRASAEVKAPYQMLVGYLKKVDADITAAYNAEPDKSKINSEWVRSILFPHVRPKEKREVPDGLIDHFEYYQEMRAADLKKPSIVKLNVVKHLLQRMERERGKRILIRDVNADFKNEFFAYSKREGYAVNTTARNFKFIKTICYHGEANGIENSPQLKHIIVRPTKVQNIYLDREDLKKIAAVKLPHEYLDNARDWLLISCETGQRVSDFLRFTPNMIRKHGDKSLIEFVQVKTGKIMTVPLSKAVLAILAKRSGNFPRRISDQKYNQYIKEVCRLAGLTYQVQGSIINEHNRKETGTFEKYRLVTSHIGRRSFATNYYGIIPTALLIAATGHTTEGMFLAYIGKSSADRALALAEYF